MVRSAIEKKIDRSLLGNKFCRYSSSRVIIRIVCIQAALIFGTPALIGPILKRVSKDKFILGRSCGVHENTIRLAACESHGSPL